MVLDPFKEPCPHYMNRVMRAFQRDITFMVFEKTIQFRIPIHTVRGDEFFLNCSVPKDGVPVLTYEVVKTPMSLTIEIPETANKIDGSSRIR